MRYSLPVASEGQNDGTSDLSPIFSDEVDASGTSSTGESEPDSGDDACDDDSILDNEEWQELPGEHYLQEAEHLNISQLQQKHYSTRFQQTLDKTQEYWDQ
ncbi:hypothetical protein BDV38DRAFT_288767 [Aspergillus pseudotamarii]|uniref:Uncharacterized protein n=1 Tax=Aspergillus pseudotamarii TaxID=132259 RepID=A0A5N6S9Z8_ASPPS|nr:uncharacterized protein BDV38DRAFT_288767 [Aspergillus pseudotamarii]KAE8131385.1 hypothetical protein BDV38DRAFT_288767 [Aspergillus pseudotamarii]